MFKASQAKKSEYGDCAKYVTFSSTDQNGNETDGKVKVTINQKLIDKSIELAGYNMLVTSEISMSKEAIYEAFLPYAHPMILRSYKSITDAK